MTDNELTADDAIASLMAYRKIEDHLKNLIKTRTYEISGDVSHITIDYIINKLHKDIDKPKEYDFQEDNHNEREFMRAITNMFDYFSIRILLDENKVNDVIAGISSLKLDGTYNSRCNDCGEQLFLTVSGNKIHIAGDHQCKSNRYYTIDIDFPTGEVVYDDMPDRLSEVEGLRNRNFDVNGIKGKRLCSEHYAKYNMLHMFVGNTCPSVCFSYDTNQFMIGCNVSCDEDSGDEIDNPLFAGFTDVGSICTDLWWTTLIDKSFYDKFITDLPAERDTKYYKKNVNTFTIPPGKYRFTARYGMNALDYYTEDGVYITGERIGDCT